MWQFYGRSFNLFDSSWLGFGFGLMFCVLILWSIVWKGLALWRAGRNNDKWWFIALLVVNTAGILEILYLSVFGKGKIGMGEKKK